VLLCGTGSSCASLPYFKGGDDRDILVIGRSVVGGGNPSLLWDVLVLYSCREGIRMDCVQCRYIVRVVTKGLFQRTVRVGSYS
jgi:hypothetical protein